MHFYTSMKKKSVAFDLVQIAEEIVKGAIDFDVDIDGDMNGFNFDWFYLNLMPGAGRLAKEQTSREKAAGKRHFYWGHVTSSPSSIGCLNHIEINHLPAGENLHPTGWGAADRHPLRWEQSGHLYS